jgi:uncharacterized protein with von Willebrand factor type A (vWA) domain
MSTDVLPARLVEFANSLRGHGIAVGPGETVDAAAAVDVLGLADRERLREALACSMLRRSGQRSVFDGVFDLYFPAAVGASDTSAEPPADLASLRDGLVAALAEGDQARVRALAASGIDAFGQYGTFGDGGSGGSGSDSRGSGGLSGWSAYQTLEQVRPDALLNRVLAAMRTETSLDASLAEREARTRIDAFSEHVRAEARRRTAELRGRERISRYAVSSQADLVSFTTANRDQLAELRRTIQPLSRKLATRLAARRRRTRRGQFDMRRTMRRSLATGGVPIRPVLRDRRPARPELVLLCDMSGSVSGFAQFTLLLVQALSDQFSKIRTFAFVGLTDEITGLVGTADPEGLATRIMSEARLTKWDSSSHYGDALDSFVTGWPDAIGPRTSVLILGDGRTNGGAENHEALRDIAAWARHVYWLNPESEALWGTGDSAALRYGKIVPMFECRNVRQLSHLVTELLPG